jgi:hypothetical protein
MKDRLVLMEYVRHHEDMFGVIILTLLLVVGPLAVFAGVDSRIDDVARRRRHNG